MSYAVRDRLKQVSTSTGTGDFVLGPAVTGYLAISAVLTDLRSFVYEIHGVDGSGVPTGEWETGVGQYWLDGATPTLRRLFKLEGSNAGSPAFVTFSAGTKHISLTVAASQAKTLKVGLDAFNQLPTFYVRSDGSDGNSGLANTADHAFATLGGAMSVVSASFREANIVIGAGTFGGGVATGDCQLTISGAGAGATTIESAVAYGGAKVAIYDVKFVGTTENALRASGAGSCIFAELVEFGAVTGGHIVSELGGQIELGDYDVSGGCSSGAHMTPKTSGTILATGVTSLLANVTMANGWVHCPRAHGSVEFSGASFSLGGYTVTGKRYDIQACSVCDTNGGGASFLPGTVAGTTVTGGQYL